MNLIVTTERIIYGAEPFEILRLKEAETEEERERLRRLPPDWPENYSCRRNGRNCQDRYGTIVTKHNGGEVHVHH